MILKKLEMDNFMPFYLHNEIDFTPQHGHQIVLLKGDNGSGKSSTFDAMNFVLFGTPVEGVGGEMLREQDMVNLKVCLIN